MPRSDSPVAQQRWLDVLNTTDEVIPAYACMYLNSAGLLNLYVGGGDPELVVFEVIQIPEFGAFNDPVVTHVEQTPYGYGCLTLDGWSARLGYFCFNGPTPIPPGGIGRGTCDLPTIARCTGAFLVTGQRLLPRMATWNLGVPLLSDCPPREPGLCDDSVLQLVPEFFRVLHSLETAGDESGVMFCLIDKFSRLPPLCEPG